jgi:NAD(P)H-nitrite reductase large subunit
MSAARAARKRNAAARITIFEKGNEAPYARVYLPHAIAGMEARKMTLGGREIFSDRGVTLRKGEEVLEINTRRQRVRTSRGSTSYDKLLIATGGRPVMPAIRGSGEQRVFTLRDLDDARRIARAMKGAGSAALLGAGLVCMETAASLIERGVKPVFIVKSRQVLSRMLDGKAAAMVEKKLRKAGARFIKGRGVKSIERAAGKKEKLKLTLTDRRKVTVDFVVVGKGVRPHVGLARAAGIKVRGGIVVDDKMRTSAANVFAAGDAALARDFLSGRQEIFGIWPTAVEQGMMAGGDAEFSGGIKANILTLGDTVVASMGRLDGRARGIETHTWSRGESYRKIFVQEGRLVGALSVGMFHDAGLLMQLIRRGRDLGAMKGRVLKGRMSYAGILSGRP